MKQNFLKNIPNMRFVNMIDLNSNPYSSLKGKARHWQGNSGNSLGNWRVVFVCHIFFTAFIQKPGFWFLSILSNDARSTMKQICTLFVIFVLSILDSTFASSGEVMGCGGFVKSNKNNIDLSRIQISLYEKRNNIQRYMPKLF